MREYEIVYIFRSSFTPEEIEAKLDRYHALLTGDGKGEITAVEQWGKRQLAYPIQKQTSGYYVVAQFTADPAALAEFERVLKLEDDLLRYLIVLSEGELPIPESMRADMEEGPEPRPGAARKAADEDDEDEDVDEADDEDEDEADDEDSDEADDEDEDEADDEDEVEPPAEKED